MIPFPFKKTIFFFCCRPSPSWPVLYKSKEWLEPSIMSERDKIFNERDRRYAAVQLMLSTDPSYDNRTIANTLKMQIRTIQRLRAQLNASDDPLEVLERKPKAEDTTRKSSSKRSRQSLMKLPSGVVIPWCNQVAGGRPWVWQQDSAPAYKSKETQAWLQKEYYDFVPCSHWPPPLSTWTRWTTLFGHTSRTSPTWAPTTPKPAWSPPSAEYSPSSRRRLWKKHAPSSGSVSRRWLRLKAATLNRCHLYYIIKLAELIFSIKVLK